MDKGKERGEKEMRNFDQNELKPRASNIGSLAVGLAWDFLILSHFVFLCVFYFPWMSLMSYLHEFILTACIFWCL